MQTKEQIATLVVSKLKTDPVFAKYVDDSCEPCNAALYTFVTGEQPSEYTDEQWGDIMDYVWDAMCNYWEHDETV